MAGDRNRNLVGALCYLLGFITGGVVLFTEERDKFIRFHAVQSLVSTGSLFLLNIVFGIVSGRLGFLGAVADILGVIIWIVIPVICVLGFVMAWQGKVFKLPVFGAIAERRA